METRRAARGSIDGLLERNASANILSRIGVAAVGLICIPFYIHFLGIGSYGLVGVFNSIAALAVVLDFGIGATIMRELARLSCGPDGAPQMRDLIRTLEVAYWGLALVIGATLALSSRYLAMHWLHSETLSPETVRHSVLCMAVLISVQAPIAVYAYAITGLQRQVALSIIELAIAPLRGLGAILVLWLVSPTIEAFLVWQCIAAVAFVIIAAVYLRSIMPKAQGRARVSLEPLRGRWLFAAETGGSNLADMLFAYADKIILSQILKLEVFGYYIVAWELATRLQALAPPMFNALYPRLAQLASLGNAAQVSAAFHRGAQLFGALLVPLAAFLVVFAFPFILLWTRNPLVALNAAPLAALLAVGMAIRGLFYAPKALLWSHGCTRPVLFGNLVSLAATVPAMVYFATKFGAPGGAAALLGTCALAFALVVVLIARRPEAREIYACLWQDLLPPTVASFAIIGAWGWLFRSGEPASVEACEFLLALLTAYVGAALAVPAGRVLLGRIARNALAFWRFA